MTATLIDGKAFAARLRERVGARALEFAAAAGRKPGLAVVLVGDDPASQVYVGSKGKATLAANMNSYEHRLPADTSAATLAGLSVMPTALAADPARKPSCRNVRQAPSTSPPPSRPAQVSRVMSYAVAATSASTRANT